MVIEDHIFPDANGWTCTRFLARCRSSLEEWEYERPLAILSIACNDRYRADRDLRPAVVDQGVVTGCSLSLAYVEYKVAQDRRIQLKLQGSKGPVHAYNAGHLFLYASNTLEIYFQC